MAKIVQFADGSYGVRRGFIWYQYLDATRHHVFWWSGAEYVDKYCKFDTVEDAERMYKEKTIKAKIIKTVHL